MHVSTKVMCNSKFMELSGTLLSSVLQIMMKQNPFPEERKKREEERHALEPQPEPGGTSKS